VSLATFPIGTLSPTTELLVFILTVLVRFLVLPLLFFFCGANPRLLPCMLIPRALALSGHGTHVAGIAASKNYGVATNAWVIPMKVFSCGRTTSTSTIVSAVSVLPGFFSYL
jgi:hypothetical protein